MMQLLNDCVSQECLYCIRNCHFQINTRLMYHKLLNVVLYHLMQKIHNLGVLHFLHKQKDCLIMSVENPYSSQFIVFNN
jgi:hypothetical protein